MTIQMDNQTASWIVMAVLMAFGIQAVALYATVKLYMTGRGMLVRREEDERDEEAFPSRVHFGK